MKTSRFGLLLAVCLLAQLVLPGIASADPVVLDFEDLYPGYETSAPIPAGYHGFTWSENSYWITNLYNPGSGYEYGTIGKVSLFTAWAAAISYGGVTFNLSGAYVTAAWNNDQDVVVEGWRSGVKVYETTIVTSCGQAYWWDFNFMDVDTVWFRPGELGTHACSNGSGHHVVIDNITMKDTEPVCPDDAAIDLEKYVNGEDVEGPPGPEIPVGSEVVFTYKVTNTGLVPLIGGTISDDHLGIICRYKSLAVGETLECTATAIAAEGPYVNRAKTGAACVPETGPKVPIKDFDYGYYLGVLVNGN